MQFLNTVLACAALFASAQAAPLAKATTDAAAVEEVVARFTPADAHHPLAKRDNHCHASSFVGETTGGSPSVSSCQQLRNNIVGGGTWTQAGGFRQLASAGDCKFVVENYSGITLYQFGNEDIRDIIADSINRFQSGGRVGATGIVPCNAAGGSGVQVPIRWFIHKV